MTEISQGSSANNKEIALLYDGECPACRLYCESLEVDPQFGVLNHINVRRSPDTTEELAAHSLDIDLGVVAKINGQLHHGCDAITQLALVSNKSTVFNTLNYWIFRSPLRTKTLYPLLRLLRNLLLKILRKTKVNRL